MLRALPFGLVGLVLLALWLYAIFDVVSTDASEVRNLPKGIWLLLVVFVPQVGSIAWLILGRPLNASWQPGNTRSRPTVARGPEDRGDWGRGTPSPPSSVDEARLRAWEDDLARRERELRKDDGDPPKGGDEFPSRG